MDDEKKAFAKRDIESREDILALLKVFYQKLLSDASVSYIFTDVAKINLDHHFPILADFWEMVIFHKDTYRKNAMQVHTNLNSLTPLTAKHFKTWLTYFNQTVDEFYEGEKAFLAKQRAQSIAVTMQIKIANSKL